jgi:hypothetical protein
VRQDRNPVSRPDAQVHERKRQLTHHTVKLLVGDLDPLATNLVPERRLAAVPRRRQPDQVSRRAGAGVPTLPTHPPARFRFAQTGDSTMPRHVTIAGTAHRGLFEGCCGFRRLALQRAARLLERWPRSPVPLRPASESGGWSSRESPALLTTWRAMVEFHRDVERLGDAPYSAGHVRQRANRLCSWDPGALTASIAVEPANRWC